MKKLLTVVSTEWIKTKGLGLLYIAFALGVLIPLFAYVPSFFRPEIIEEGTLKYSIFERMVENESIKYFTFLMLLLFIIIAANRIAQTDHKNNGWQLMETQPVSKFQLYFSKYIVLFLLSVLCVSFYFISSIILEIADYYIHPNPVKVMDFDALWMIKTYIRVCITILGISALQLCVSVVFSGFIWSFLIGCLGIASNITSLVQKQSFFFNPYSSLYSFWKAPEIRNLNCFISYSEYMSIFWMFVFLIIGYFWYSRKSFKNAFMKNRKQAIISLALFILGAGFLYLFQKPNSYKTSSKGISISGTVKTDLKIDSIKIYTTDFHKKIGAAEIKNNKFTWTTKENLPLDEYLIEIGNKKLILVMASGDWFDIDFKLNNTKLITYIKSNRKADQIYRNEEHSFGDEFRYALENQDYINNPKKFYELAQADWNESKRILNVFADPENNALSDNYKFYRRQLIAIQYINEINNYRKLTSWNDPKFAPPKDFINELNENIRRPSNLLSKNDDYLQFKLDNLLTNKDQLADTDSILFVKINQLPKGLQKDQLLSKHLSKTIEIQHDSIARNKLFFSEINKINNADYKAKLYSTLEQINRSQKGTLFTNLTFLNDTGKTVNLSKFRGKYVVMDLWATWCAPCTQIRPVFEARNNQYKYYSNIQFISVNLDENQTKWKNYIKTKPSNIPQFWLNNANKFMAAYKIQSIPRFIIIDPEGKIFNLNTPFPDEDNFVEILEKLKKY